MNNNILLLGAAVAAVLVLNKAKAKTAPAGSASAPAAMTNLNGQMWSSLLGGAWKLIPDAQNADGSLAFLKTNWLGQVVTSDGKPVGQDYNDLMTGTAPVDFSLGGTDYLGGLPFSGMF